MTFYQYYSFWVLFKNPGKSVERLCRSSFNLVTVGVEIHPGVFGEGNIDPLAYSGNFGTGYFLFDTFGLAIHTIPDIATGNPTYYTANNSAEYGIPFSDIVPDYASDGCASSGTNYGTFLLVIGILDCAASQSQTGYEEEAKPCTYN
jgi:hypothetical protein